ncbi:MAG: coproporphyrinogen III oxidase [Deltaproteobacteria bacterium]|nr:coproporphyrinogen III oxidase [Deltaproteobacteria bacterium]
MDKTIGVYVHIPFCERICPYCDFAVEAARDSALKGNGSQAWEVREAEYVENLLREFALRAPAFEGLSIASLYFGGGTPSLFAPSSLLRIREAVTDYFSECAEGLEVTLEVNPSTVERERLKQFRLETRVNRLSVGVQSFDDSILKSLGRAHLAHESHSTIEAARDAGFENLSIDLMFAALHQTPEMLSVDLERALEHAPEHISIYELVFEDRTPFGRAAARGELKSYPEEGAADLLDQITHGLRASGYRRYELTNYSQPGFESAHNQRYWRRQPVLGIGVGAHSMDVSSESFPFGARRENFRDRRRWEDHLREGDAPHAVSEELTRLQAISEACFLSLRTEEGLGISAFVEEFGAPPRDFFGPVIDRLVSVGLLAEASDGRISLTESGRLLADSVSAEFVLSEDVSVGK